MATVRCYMEQTLTGRRPALSDKLLRRCLVRDMNSSSPIVHPEAQQQHSNSQEQQPSERALNAIQYQEELFIIGHFHQEQSILSSIALQTTPASTTITMNRDSTPYSRHSTPNPRTPRSILRNSPRNPNTSRASTPYTRHSTPGSSRQPYQQYQYGTPSIIVPQVSFEATLNNVIQIESIIREVGTERGRNLHTISNHTGLTMSCLKSRMATYNARVMEIATLTIQRGISSVPRQVQLSPEQAKAVVHSAIALSLCGMPLAQALEQAERNEYQQARQWEDYQRRLRRYASL
ncbi:hypothetical protein EDD36DRAFT_423379 [Exophiala viscosa]|uniref:Uncharacterized protein n=1 Tax=Exophiala viscosa TaxID=2486360 RepID=A0AAN6IAA0_9EURO|nr:hypothetical protein EDD36DRAFT_423379 [Exophiala viscosa]